MDSPELALRNALQAGDLPALRILLLTPPSLFKWHDQDGSSLFSKACQLGHLPLLKHLLSKRRKREGIWATFKALLSFEEQVMLNLPGKGGMTPFLTACRSGHLEVVRFLAADSRVDVNWIDYEGQSPLFVASKHGHLGVVRFLLGLEQEEGQQRQQERRRKGGREREREREKGRHGGGGGGREEIKLERLGEKEAKRQREQERETRRRLDLTKLLRPNRSGMTALYAACQGGHLEVVRCLLYDGRISPNQPAKDGTTPFYVCCDSGHLALVKYFSSLGSGINLNHPASNGATPFFMACQRGHVAIVEHLSTHGWVDVNRPKLNGTTPFTIACAKGQEAIVEVLLRVPQVRINQPQHDGSTPLWMAAHYNQLGVIKRILASGRRVETLKVCAYNQTTAAERARQRKNHVVGYLLEEYQRDPFRIRTWLRKELGMIDQLASELFALIIFHCDDLLQLK